MRRHTESSRRQDANPRVASSRHGSPGRRRSLRHESGELLIELLMTTSIVTICVIGLVGALGSNFRFSAVSREITNADQLLARYSEALSAVAYEPCGGATPYTAAATDAVPAQDLPDNVTVTVPGKAAKTAESFELSVESVQYWNGDTSPATFTDTCPKSDPGVQRLVVLVAAGDGSVARRATIVKAAS